MVLLDGDTARPDESAAEAAKRDLEESDEQRVKRNVLCGFPLIRPSWWFMHDYRQFEFRERKGFL
jgi:hypothetical protein